MLIAHDTLIMVLDGARMAMFRNKGNVRQPSLELLVQERRITPRTAELGDDRPGRTFQGTGYRRGSYDAVDLHQLVEDAFIQEMSETLTSLMRDDEAQAILIAPPHALGLVRKSLPADIRQRLIAEIDKDYAGRLHGSSGQDRCQIFRF
jgi:protein required for attachment to host cells